MTLPATPFRKEHTLTGSIVPLLYDWKVEDKAHLLVTLVNTSVTPNTESTLAVDTDYTVNSVGSNTGTITPASAHTAGWKIVITSNVPYEQNIDFTNQNSVKPEEVENMADKLGRQIKQIVEVLSRTVKTTVGGGVQPDDLLDAINDAVTQTSTNAGLTAADVITSGNNVTAAQAAQSAAESAAAGIKWRPSVRASTTGALPACTYSNGASGVGATLTGNSNGALAAQDGITLTVGQDLLVKDQAAQLQNGVYRLTQVGTGGTPFILTRRTDADSWLELVSQAVIIEEGTTLADIAYICTVNQGGTIGTTGVTWGTFSPPLVIASQAEAEGNTENTKAMSSLRVYQQVTNRIASVAEMLSGAANKIVSAANFKAWFDTKYAFVAPVTITTGIALAQDFAKPAGMTPTRFAVNFNGFSTNGSSIPLIQLSDAGGPETSGYLGATETVVVTQGAAVNGTSASNVAYGTAYFELTDPATNTWSWSYVYYIASASGVYRSAGMKSLSQALTGFRLTTVGGTDQADSGTLSITWEG